MDLQPLLNTLAKVSAGRVMPHVDIETAGNMTIAKIPVRFIHTADKTDVALRRYIADWLRTNMGEVSVDTRFEKVAGASWYDDNGQETPLVGIIYVSWWPRPQLTEHEQLLADQRARRKAAENGE